MRMLLNLPLLAAVICGLQSSVQSRALPDSSIAQNQGSCQGPKCPLDWKSLAPRAEPVRAPHDDPSSGKGNNGGNPNDPTTDPNDPNNAPAHIGTDDSPSTADPKDPPVHIGTDPNDSATPPPSVDDALKTYLSSHYGEGQPQLIGDSKNYNDLMNKGQKVDNILQTTLKTNGPDVDIPPLTQNYEVRDRDQNLRLNAVTDKDLADPFSLLSLDMSQAKYSTSRVFSKTPAASAGDQGVVAGGKFFDQDGVIVGEDRFSANDLNPAGSRTRPSDITFQQYESFASHIGRNGKLMRGYTNDVNKLKAFVGRNILSKSTVETTFAAHFKTGQSMDSPGVFKRDSQGAEREAFDAFLGTDFISSLMYMLSDHHQALGNKQISEIHTFPRTFTTSNTGGRQKLDIVVLFQAL